MHLPIIIILVTALFLWMVFTHTSITSIIFWPFRLIGGILFVLYMLAAGLYELIAKIPFSKLVKEKYRKD